jgi:hypothetical protein
VLTRVQRLVLGLALVGAWRWLDAPFAGLLGVVLLGFALFTAPAREADHEAFAWFAITAGVLAWLSKSYAMAVAAGS